MHVEVIRYLVNRYRVLLQFMFGIARVGQQAHVHHFGIALVKFDGLHQTQYHKPIMNEQPNVAIVIEQGTPLLRRAL